MRRPAAILTDADDGSTVALRVGDTFLLQLFENAATGYRWTVETLDRASIGIREFGFLRRSDAVGGGGDVQWMLEAKAPATTGIAFRLARAWGGDAAANRRFCITLVIRQH